MLNTKCIFKCFMIHCHIILPTCICTTINKYQWPKMSSCQFYTSIATAGHSSSTSWDQKFPQVSPVYPWVYRYDVSGHKSKGTQPLKMISSSCYVVWNGSGSLGYKQSTWLILFILACKTNLTALSWSPTKMTVKNKRSLGFSAGGLFVDC